jgi:autotransporter-associated beta strand protein
MTTILTLLPHHRFSGTASQRLLLAAAMLLGGAMSVQAQTLYYWSGGGANASWATAGNFQNSPTSSTNSTPTSSDQTQLVFGARVATGLVASNATAGFNVSALIFSNTSAQSFTITGSQIEFKKVGSVNPQIRQESSAAQTIATGIKLAEPLTLGGNGTGLVTMTGAWEAGSKGINKTGTSAFFIDVASVANSGTVTISNGTLALRSGTNLVGGVIQLRGGVLAASGTFSRALGTGAANVNFGAGGGGFAAYGGALTVSTAFATWGGANALPTNAPLILGSAIANNVVTLSGTNNLGTGGTRVIQLVDNTNSAADAAVISGVISGAANLQVTGAGILSLTAANTYGGTNFIGGGTVRATTLANAGTSSSLGTNASIVITNGGVLEYVGTTNSAMNRVINLASGNGGIGVSNSAAELTISGAISNTGSLVKSGAGTLALTASNSYGGTTISAGSLKIGTNGTTGTLGSGNVTNNAALIFHRSNDLTVSNVISGTGAVTKLGAGTLTLIASNSYGATTISAGALQVGAGSTAGTLGTNAVTNNAALIFNRSNDLSVSNAISGTGAVTKLGAGTLTLIASNSYGATTISAGALQVGNGGTTGTLGTNAVINNAALIFNRSDNLTASNAISGAGSLTKLGAGTVILTASNSYGGGTLLNAGALAAGNAFAFGTGSITLTNSTVLNLSNFSIANLIINNGGILTNVGTVSGAELNGGTTTLSASNSTVAEVSGTATVNVSGNNTTITNVLGGTVSVAGTNTTLQSVSSGTVNVAGTNTTVQNLTGGTVNVTNGTTVNVQSGSTAGSIAGGGGLVKSGANTLTLSGANTFSGGTVLLDGTLAVASANALGSGSLTQTNGSSTLVINTTGTVTNQMSVSNLRSLQTVTLSGNKTLNNASYDITNNTTTTESGTLSGSGGITKLGTGTLVVTASNTFTGAVDVQAGLLNLNSATSSAAGGTTSVAVATNATLLISRNNQVNNTATVSLSGGTIRTAGGVSEVFGNLSVTGSGTLDFGATFGNASSMNFGTYTPSALLTINNFDFGSSLTFKSDLRSTINNSSLFTFTNGGIASSNWDGTTFTITAIPEPSTYLAAAGLLAVLLWPSRRRLLKDAKSILGLRAPMRDRLAGKA